jgi:hypothetical protein
MCFKALKSSGFDIEKTPLKDIQRKERLIFIWYDCYVLKIPNTTNAIDGHFSDLKNKLRNHNGLSIARKIKFIDEFFKV